MLKEMYNYVSCILFSVSLTKTMKKFSSPPLKSPTCENVLNHPFLGHDALQACIPEGWAR